MFKAPAYRLVKTVYAQPSGKPRIASLPRQHYDDLDKARSDAYAVIAQELKCAVNTDCDTQTSADGTTEMLVYRKQDDATVNLMRISLFPVESVDKNSPNYDPRLGTRPTWLYRDTYVILWDDGVHRILWRDSIESAPNLSIAMDIIDACKCQVEAFRISRDKRKEKGNPQ